MSENLTRLAHKIDFGKKEADFLSTSDSVEGEESKELATFQASLWPWDSVRTKLRYEYVFFLMSFHKVLILFF